MSATFSSNEVLFLKNALLYYFDEAHEYRCCKQTNEEVQLIKFNQAKYDFP